METKEKINNGITLISLVVSIIIIIIISTISINMAIGENGVISRSVKTKDLEHIENAKRELEDGYRRLEYYEKNNADVGVTIGKLYNITNLNNYVTGRINGFISRSDGSTKMIYTNENGSFTVSFTNDGDMEMQAGLFFDEKDNGFTFSINDEKKLNTGDNYYFAVQDEYRDMINIAPDGTILDIGNIDATIPIEIRDAETNQVVSIINLVKSAVEVIDAAQLLLNGIPDEVRKAFVEIVSLEDNCYAAYYPNGDNKTYSVMIFTDGPGGGVIFGDTINTRESGYARRRKKIEFTENDFYSKVRQIIICDGVTTVPYSCLDNFTDLDYLYIGKDVTDFGPYFCDVRYYRSYSQIQISLPEYLYDDGMENWYVPKKLYYLDYNAEDCDMSFIDVRLKMFTNIDDSHFENVYSLNIGDNVKVIPSLFTSYNSKLSSVNIPKNVTEIEAGAFAYTDIKNLHFEENWHGKLGNNAFIGCVHLKEVIIPDSVGPTELGLSTFAYCTSLEKVVLGEGVTDLGQMTFQLCIKLNYVSIPSTIDITDEYNYINAFLYVNSIKEVYWNNPNLRVVKVFGVQSYSGFDHDSTTLEKIVIGDKVNKIIDYCFFQNGNLKEITIPDNVTEVGEYAFGECYSLETVDLNKVQKVNKGMLYHSNIKKLIVPNTITSLADYCFAYSKSIDSVYWNVSEYNPYVDYSNGMSIFISAYQVDGESYFSNIKSIEFGPDVIHIPRFFIAYNYYLKKVYISTNHFQFIIDDFAFYNCVNLDEIYLENVNVIGYQAFAYSGAKKLTLIFLEIYNMLWNLNMSYGAFLHNDNLEVINYNVFKTWSICGPISYTGDDITGYPPLGWIISTDLEVNIGPDVRTLGDYSLYGLYYLQSITIPTTVERSSLTSITLYKGPNLTSVMYGGVNIINEL